MFSLFDWFYLKLLISHSMIDFTFTDWSHFFWLISLLLIDFNIGLISFYSLFSLLMINFIFTYWLIQLLLIYFTFTVCIPAELKLCSSFCICASSLCSCICTTNECFKNVRKLIHCIHSYPKMQLLPLASFLCLIKVHMLQLKFSWCRVRWYSVLNKDFFVTSIYFLYCKVPVRKLKWLSDW